MTNAPTLNGQIIGQAEKATRAVFDDILDGIGTSFLPWVTLNLLRTADAPLAQDELVLRVRRGLKTDEPPVRAAVDELLADGLVRSVAGDPSTVDVTAAGDALYERVTAGIAAIAARLYGDLPADELATAARVLTLVTERANAVLGD